MAKLIMWNLSDLDGFFAGPNRDEKSPERLKLSLLDARPLSSGIVILRYAPAA